MARGNPNWGKQDVASWRFRVRGQNPSGEMVTLGSYVRESEAEARRQELLTEGYYREVVIEPVEPAPSETDDESSQEAE